MLNNFLRMFGFLFYKKYYDKDTANFLMSHIDGNKILSIGCGDGSIESLINQNKHIEIQGLEIIDCRKPKIPIKIYKGDRFPFRNKAFDEAMFVYSLHHTKNKNELEQVMREAIRVSKKNIIILDHIYDNFLDKFSLSIWDYFGNKLKNFNVEVTFNYLKEKEWLKIFENLNLHVEMKKCPFDSIFFKLKV